MGLLGATIQAISILKRMINPILFLIRHSIEMQMQLLVRA